jgi:hypothetical protein
MSDAVLKNIGSSEANRLQAFMSSMYIIEYGIIKKIPAEGIVTVEMSVAESKEDIIVTNCVYANIASSAFCLTMKPKVDDKVMVFFPRKFMGGMFRPENKEALVSECGNGYSLMGGIAVPLNQYQESVHKNHIEFTDTSMSMIVNGVELSISPDKDIEVKNGKATITVDKDGNVTVDTQGKYNFKNATTSQKEVIDGLAQAVENLVTTGSPATQSTSPATKANIATWRSSKLNQLYQ